MLAGHIRERDVPDLDVLVAPLVEELGASDLCDDVLGEDWVALDGLDFDLAVRHICDFRLRPVPRGGKGELLLRWPGVSCVSSKCEVAKSRAPASSHICGCLAFCCGLARVSQHYGLRHHSTNLEHQDVPSSRRHTHEKNDLRQHDFFEHYQRLRNADRGGGHDSSVSSKHSAHRPMEELPF